MRKVRVLRSVRTRVDQKGRDKAAHRAKAASAWPVQAAEGKTG